MNANIPPLFEPPLGKAYSAPGRLVAPSLSEGNSNENTNENDVVEYKEAQVQHACAKHALNNLFKEAKIIWDVDMPFRYVLDDEESTREECLTNTDVVLNLGAAKSKNNTPPNPADGAFSEDIFTALRELNYEAEPLSPFANADFAAKITARLSQSHVIGAIIEVNEAGSNHFTCVSKYPTDDCETYEGVLSNFIYIDSKPHTQNNSYFNYISSMNNDGETNDFSTAKCVPKDEIGTFLTTEENIGGTLVLVILVSARPLPKPYMSEALKHHLKMNPRRPRSKSVRRRKNRVKRTQRRNRKL
jgi:hypothetical protein